MPTDMHICYIHIKNTPVGTITAEEKDGCIVSLHIGETCRGEYKKTELLSRCESQLMEYFDGKRISFDIPVALTGTAFQQSVWQALMDIPYGETITYSQLAQRTGRPKAARAAGAACGANPLLIIVPCHRVVGQKGLTGYAGGLDSKKTLLKIEKSGK